MGGRGSGVPLAAGLGVPAELGGPLSPGQGRAGPQGALCSRKDSVQLGLGGRNKAPITCALLSGENIKGLIKSHTSFNFHLFTYFFKRIYLFIFREGRSEGGEREKKTSIGCPLNTPQPGTEPETQTCALTRNQTGDLLL